MILPRSQDFITVTGGIKHAYKYHTAASGFYLVKNEQILALALLQLATESKQTKQNSVSEGELL